MKRTSSQTQRTVNRKETLKSANQLNINERTTKKINGINDFQNSIQLINVQFD